MEETAQSPVKLSKKDRPALDDIVKLDLIKDKSTEEIQHIWLEYHKGIYVIRCNSNGLLSTH